MEKLNNNSIKELCLTTNRNGYAKLFIYLFFIVGAGFLISLEDYFFILLGQLILGLFFAHGLELQHEALHGILFKNKILNYMFGLFLGLPMGVSYTHYKVQHLHHHKYLGTEDDDELFDYDSKSLESPVPFIKRAFNIERVPSIFKILSNLLNNKYPENFDKETDKRTLKFEYFIILSLFVIAITYTILTKDFLVIKFWFIPWFIFGEVFHFLIELPEHINCDKNLDIVYRNTRTIRTKNKGILYIVNGNNYHVEHHMYPNVAIKNLKKIHASIRHEIKYQEYSYAGFYLKILKQVFTK